MQHIIWNYTVSRITIFSKCCSLPVGSRSLQWMTDMRKKKTHTKLNIGFDIEADQLYKWYWKIYSHLMQSDKWAGLLVYRHLAKSPGLVYIVACQGGGVSIKPVTRTPTRHTLGPFSPLVVFPQKVMHMSLMCISIGVFQMTENDIFFYICQRFCSISCRQW